MLILDRSILTEKIARRGLHLTCDYTTDPLEAFFVARLHDRNEDTLRTRHFVALPASGPSPAVRRRRSRLHRSGTEKLTPPRSTTTMSLSR